MRQFATIATNTFMELVRQPVFLLLTTASAAFSVFLAAVPYFGFGDDPVAMLQFALRAAPKDFAALAPLIFDHAEAGDPVAAALVGDAVRDVEALARRLAAEGVGRIALAGGLASRYRPRLAVPPGAAFTEPTGDALAGAILMARSGGA